MWDVARQTECRLAYLRLPVDYEVLRAGVYSIGQFSSKALPGNLDIR